MGWRLLPQTDMQKNARNYINNLIYAQPEYPVQDIANLTPIQQQIQQYLSGNMGSANDMYNTASGVYKDYLTSDYDPATSNYWKGYRAVAESQKAQALKSDRQRTNAGGMLRSTPGSQIEGTTRQNYDNAQLAKLGKLQENELNRRLGAASNAQRVQSQYLGNMATTSGIADQQRAIEQAQNDAVYKAAMQTLLHPYTYSTALAEAITSEQMYYYKSKSSSGGLGGIGSVVGSVLGGGGGSSILSGLGGLVSGIGSVGGGILSGLGSLGAAAIGLL